MCINTVSLPNVRIMMWRYINIRIVASLASVLSAESEETSLHVRTLLYTLGEDNEDVLLSVKISKENRKNYTEVMAKLEVRKNVIYEHAWFNRRIQVTDI